MSGFFENLLQDAAGAFFGSDYLRDYTHASKTFRANGYANSPKFKFLFHVYFDINTEAYPVGLPTGANFGLAVKNIKLPSYSFATHEMNQYNRKRIVQTKIKYESIDIDFHDDNGDMIRDLWYAYYTYYYKDATHLQSQGTGPGQIAPAPVYNERTQYQPSIAGNEDWGYSGEPSSGSQGTKKIPFFKNITVFGFNRHNFSAYTLINPVITRFSHDTYNYAEGSGTMENKMTVDYETVKYYKGAMAGLSPDNIVSGFGAEANYDRTKSPISMPGSQNSILGQGGLLDGANGVLTDLSTENYLDAAVKAITTARTASSMNLKQSLTAEINTQLQIAYRGAPNRPGVQIIPAALLPAGGSTGTQKAPAPVITIT